MCSPSGDKSGRGGRTTKTRQRRGKVGKEAGQVGNDGILKDLEGHIGDFGLLLVDWEH